MSRLIIISNRAPISVIKADGKYTYEESAGGLASGLRAYVEGIKKVRKDGVIWIGWPGAQVDDEKKVGEEVLKQFGVYCIFLSEEVMDKFYQGFCNKTVWPLFHYFPGLTIYNQEYWQEYISVNKLFCDEALKIIQPGDTIWVHDYHLMLLPAMLREKLPDASIGFFLHIPFPSFELYRLLPSQWRKEIMEGLYGADLVGFHTYDYGNYFLNSSLHILGVSHHMNEVLYKDRFVRIGTFPMGIDFNKYHKTAISKTVKAGSKELKKKFQNVKLILSIDRQDYTKGIINRLKGYEHFLENNPKWRGKVSLVMIIVPSRIGVESYQDIKTQIDELVGNISGKYGSVDWMPIMYQYKSLNFKELIAMYSGCDVGLVTPLRDGMNLVAKEYIASRTKDNGVLILSEMAGAADELDQAIIINPNNVPDISSSILQALEVNEEEQASKIQIMQERVRIYNIFRWADDFLATLSGVKQKQKRLDARLIGATIKKKIISHFNRARSRILFLDYDGTLMPHMNDPFKAKPGKELLDILKTLAEMKDTRVILISGRDKRNMEEWFGHLNIEMAAEHGVVLKVRSNEGDSRALRWKLIKPIRKNWKGRVIPFLKSFEERLPGSFIEVKEYSITFHYRMADALLASNRIKEMVWQLESFTTNMDVFVYEGNKILEIRNAGIDKGVAVMHWLALLNYKPDFILATGDDLTDEDMFRVLPGRAYSIKIGIQSSYAHYNLRDHADMIALLKEFVNLKSKK